MPAPEGADIYGAQPHDDAWRKAANARIERYRKGNLVVHVVDAATGGPIGGATVSVNQTRHAFHFGSAVTPLLLDDSPDGEQYRKNFLRLFNFAVLENQLKWNEPVGSPNSFVKADPMIDWCLQHNIPVRGHNLFWPSYRHSPAVSESKPLDLLRQDVAAHVREYAAHEKGRVVVWDVVNEAYTNHDILDKAGRDLLWKSFAWAREQDPTAQLCYNDYDIANDSAGKKTAHRQAALAIANEIRAHGAPITELGDQAHMSYPFTPGARLVSIWDDAFKKTHLPLEITEYDAGIADDTAHAAYQDEFMTAAFSEPHVRSFVMWGFWAGAHWRADQGAALFREDWSERPAVAAYEKLVFHDWWTKAEGRSDGKGVYKTRAFLGTHDITVTVNGRTVTVPAQVLKNQDGVTPITVRI